MRNFLFHRVSPKRDKLWDPMDVQLFDRCIRYISKKYKIVLLEEAALNNQLLSNSNDLATIMFDDGYKDNIEFAAPILKKYNVKASFYVVTDCIDKNIPTWTHILEYRFQFTKKTALLMNFNFLPKELQVTELKTYEERIHYSRQIKPFLKNLPQEQRMSALKRIDEAFDDAMPPSLMMTWNDLNELKKEGHYIGSHSVSHPALGTISDEIELKNELVNSGNKIKEHLGYFPITISYPVGSFNETTKRVAKESGYKIGLAVKQNIYDPKKEDLYEISRIELYNEPWWKTRLRITNTLENFKSLIRYS